MGNGHLVIASRKVHDRKGNYCQGNFLCIKTAL